MRSRAVVATGRDGGPAAYGRLVRPGRGMRYGMTGFGSMSAMALVLAMSAVPAAAADYVPGEGGRACERGKAIEHALGRYGYRVVASGGDGGRRDQTVKMQVWENEREDWVITERFMQEGKTCVIRSGDRLHLLY